jgi:4-amino-4-deoxy-L-arabinose transferase-like glycosyltransferase
MAVAVLAKGPIGLLIPLGVAVAASLARRRFEIARMVSPLGVFLFFAIAGPWFLAIYLDQGFHFIEVFILNHNLERFTSTIHNHPGPVYYYLPVLLLGVFPWSGLVAPLFRALGTIERSVGLSLLAWLLVPLALFSLAGSKLPGYILPCLPPFVIALALAGRTLNRSDSGVAFRIAGLLGLVIAAAALAFSIRGLREGEAWGRSAIAPAAWALAATFAASRAFDRAHRESLRVLSIGAAGFLLLLTLVAPPVLEAMESGRRLFLPARGREVLVAGAWRTAWMSGYFYNDGRVREVSDLAQLLTLIKSEPRLVLLGPAEWRQIQQTGQVTSLLLAEGPRGNVLARISNRSDH